MSLDVGSRPEEPEEPEQRARWSQLKEALGDALLLEGEARARRLDELAQRDPALAAQVARLVELEAEADDYMRTPLPASMAFHGAEVLPAVGDTLGRYRLLGVLGRGGSSIVFSAEQDEPRRRVALKVLLHGQRSAAVLRRFAAESELLASLRHPAIAQVFEAEMEGAAGAPPWIAMELVESALPITSAMDARGLEREARVRLLATVCEAVAHAHRRGVIHRDLKPANVLVDGDGQPRVIDFGVAKLNSPGAAQGGTLPGSFLGTLAYMSPEQAGGDASQVDTRSDVYSLGVLAYRCLCGQLPYELSELALSSALQLIREAAPTRPRVHGVGGDLEAVLLKALEKEPDRRYASATDLGRDLLRTLAGEAVEARGVNPAYRLRCFVRCHRLAVVGTAGGILIALVATIGLSLHTARIERRERAKAEQVKDFLLSLLQLAEPGVASRPNLPLSALLEEAEPRIDAELAELPGAAFEVHETIGKAWRELGEYGRAQTHLRRAIELAIETFGDQSPEHAAALNALADLCLDSGEYPAAHEAAGQALAILERSQAPAIFRAISMRKLAEALRGSGRLEEAQTCGQAALRGYLDLLPDGHEAVARARETLGRIHVESARFELGLAELGRALSADLANHGEQSLRAARTRLELSRALAASGSEPAARSERSRALAVLTKLLPSGHPLLEAAR